MRATSRRAIGSPLDPGSISSCNLRRADAFVTTAEENLEQSWGDEGDDGYEDESSGVQRRRMRVDYLIEAGTPAVRAAGDTSDPL